MDDKRYMNPVQSRADRQVDAGLRSYMLGVYNHMTTALVLTGLFAFALYRVADSNLAVKQLFFGTPLKYAIMLAPFGLAIYLGFRINSMSAGRARIMFYTFAALMGLALSSILFAYTGASVARAFFITSGAFAGLSIYGYSTKRDLAPMGAFLVIGVVGLFLAMIVNMFFQSGMLEFTISVGGVLIFAGLTAWDTQKIKSMYNTNDSSDVAARKSIYGALTLYLDFINMFLFLLRLVGNRN